MIDYGIRGMVNWASLDEAFISLNCFAGELLAPSVRLRPKLYIDGNKWCALYGDDIQKGLVGFGNSPQKALQDFDTNFYKCIEPGTEKWETES